MLIRGSGQNCSKGSGQSQNVSFKNFPIIKFKTQQVHTKLWKPKGVPNQFDEFRKQEALEKSIKNTEGQSIIRPQVQEYMKVKNFEELITRINGFFHHSSGQTSIKS